MVGFVKFKAQVTENKTTALHDDIWAAFPNDVKLKHYWLVEDHRILKEKDRIDVKGSQAVFNYIIEKQQEKVKKLMKKYKCENVIN